MKKVKIYVIDINGSGEVQKVKAPKDWTPISVGRDTRGNHCIWAMVDMEEENIYHDVVVRKKEDGFVYGVEMPGEIYLDGATWRVYEVVENDGAGIADASVDF